MTPAFKRMIWSAIMGGLIAIGGSIGSIWATDAHDFWIQQGCVVLVVLGALLVYSGLPRRPKKSN